MGAPGMDWGLWYCSNTTQYGNLMEKEASSEMETLQWFVLGKLGFPGSTTVLSVSPWSPPVCLGLNSNKLASSS